jgi:S1-C subfamily serine protease
MKINKFIMILIILTTWAFAFANSDPYIGINMTEPSLKQLKDLNVDGNYGILLSGIVKGSPAEKAGLEKFDILQKFNGEKLYTINQLSRMIDLEEVGNKIKIEYSRDGKTKKTTITLADREDFINAAYGVHLGVYTSELTDWTLKKSGLEENYGVQLSGIVPDSPADKAGLEKNDIILELAGEKIYTGNQITKMLKKYTKGDVISLKIWRDEKAINKKVTLEYRKAKQDFFSFFEKPQNVYVYGLNENTKMIGITVDEISKSKKKELKIESGVLVDHVRDDFPAKEADIRIGDIIQKADGKAVDSATDLRDIINEFKVGEKIKLVVLRGNKTKKINVKIAEGKNDNFEINFDDEDIRIMINNKEDVMREIKEAMKDVREDMKEWKENELPEIKEDLKEVLEDIKIEIHDSGNI